jgi:hypothetical protein
VNKKQKYLNNPTNTLYFLIVGGVLDILLLLNGEWAKIPPNKSIMTNILYEKYQNTINLKASNFCWE